jgi:hypothetical protein
MSYVFLSTVQKITEITGFRVFLRFFLDEIGLFCNLRGG